MLEKNRELAIIALKALINDIAENRVYVITCSVTTNLVENPHDPYRHPVLKQELHITTQLKPVPSKD